MILLISQKPSLAHRPAEGEVHVSEPNLFSWRNWSIVLCAAAVLVAMVVAYSSVLFNFFTADDFHAIYLFDITKHNPSLLLDTFMHGVGPYYRPIWFTTMFYEYLFFGPNALFFRLVSLSLKIASTVFIVLLFLQIADDSGNQKLIRSKMAWAVTSASLFALYPLHTEPVDWVVCHIDLLTNLFVLSSLWFYIQGRKTGKIWAETLSCAIFLLALLTKETAVIIPVLISAYEIMIRSPLVSAQTFQSKENMRGIVGQLINIVRHTGAHWLMLFLYFGLRLIVVGSFIGTWNNAAFYNPDNSMIIKGWQQSLKTIFLPVSACMFDKADPVRVLWIVSMVVLVALSIWGLKENKKLIKLALFFSFWFVLCLLPVYKLLYITPDLLNARYGYLSSVPLCAFLTLGIVCSSYMAERLLLRNLLLGLVLCLSFFILRGNNLAWAEAGHLTNGVVSEIRRIHRDLDPNLQTYIVNVPFLFKGVPIEGMDSAQAINHKPFAERDSYKCQWLKNGDQSFPLALLKNEIESDKNQAAFYTWSMKDNRLSRVDLSSNGARAINGTYSAEQAPVVIDERMPALGIVSSLGEPYAVSTNTFTFSPADLNCWSTDLLVFTIDIRAFGKSKGIQFAQLDYTNEVKTDTALLDRLIVPIKPNQSSQTLIFPLRGTPIWALGGHCKNIQLTFPKGYAVHINKAYAANINKNMPQIESIGPHYDKSIGQLEISALDSQAFINYDVRSINNCAGVAIEVIGPGAYFREMNSANSDTYSLAQSISMLPKGRMNVYRKMFPTDGPYKVRLRPIDKEGHQCGFCGDHFLVLVRN